MVKARGARSPGTTEKVRIYAHRHISPLFPSLHTRRVLLGGALVVALVVATVVHLLNPTDALGDGTFLAVGWAASGAAWIGARRAPRGARLVPHCIAAGVTASALGDLTYLLYT